MSLEAIIPWATGTAVTALTLLEPFRVQYRGGSAMPSRSTLATTGDASKPKTLDFYSSIQKAVPWAPPRGVFAIWFLLYLFIAIAHTFWAIDAEPVTDTRLYRAIWIVYFVHLFFNKIWSLLFFGMQSRIGVVLGMFDILIVLALAVAQMVLYGIYGAPVVTYVLWGIYLAWILFATVLSIAIAIERNELSYPSYAKDL